MMTTDLVAVPRSFTAGEVLEHLRRSEELPQVIHDIYVVAAARISGSWVLPSARGS